MKLDCAVLCEGKYDKIKLSSVLDAMIITTDGFSVFNNSEKRSMISRICRERGLVIITDSDRAGVFIRRKLKGMLPADADIRHIYIPEIAGKEKRKDKTSKDGLLGVEGMSAKLLRKLLLDSGITESNTTVPRAERISKAQLYSLGLSGSCGATEIRKQVCINAGLPSTLTANALLEALYMLGITFSDLSDMVSKIRANGGDNYE